jgi:hypothetical protein
MVVATRLDCVVGTAAAMRQAVEQATHHASHRSAFGKLLIDQPRMANVLADLCVESEAATVTALRLARAFERAEAAFARVATPVAKYWVCKRGPRHAAEALECLGGNGYVEELGLARVYRQQPLQSIWEGSGNIQCLDVLRAPEREPESAEAFLAELEPPFRADAEAALAEAVEADARRLVERLAVALQGSLRPACAGPRRRGLRRPGRRRLRHAAGGPRFPVHHRPASADSGANHRVRLSSDGIEKDMLIPVPPTDCMRAREGASARVDGALEELESVWLDGHLSRCADCCTFAGQVAATAAVLRAAPLDPAPTGLFVSGRRRVAVPVAAVAATIAIAVTAGTSFFVGRQLGERSGGRPIAATTLTSSTRLDPGLIAMLQRGIVRARADRRVVAI